MPSTTPTFRMTATRVLAIQALALIGLWRVLPRQQDEEAADMRAEFAALRGTGLWLALSTTVLFSAAVFCIFTYVAPLLGEVTGVSPRGVTWSLLLIGLGLTLGNILGGRLADWKLAQTLMGVFVALAVASSALTWTSSALRT